MLYAICYEAAMTQLSALSSEQAEWKECVIKRAHGSLYSGFQYTLIFRQVIQIICIMYNMYWSATVYASFTSNLYFLRGGVLFLRIVIPEYRSERVVYVLNDTVFISLLLPWYLQYYTILNVKYSFQIPSSISCLSDLSSTILNFPIHYNIILNIYGGCAVPQINVDQEEGLSFSC